VFRTVDFLTAETACPHPLPKRETIEVAWNRGRVDTLNRAFGCRVCTPEDKPTNGEFIAMLADKLSLERSA